MIRVASPQDVGRLVSRVLSAPEGYTEAVLCSPFLDEDMVVDLAPKITAAGHAHCGVRIITSPQSRRALLPKLPGHRGIWEPRIVCVQDLHAKAYLAVGRRVRDTRAIVTSSNFTAGGLGGNLELGVIASPSTDTGQNVISEVGAYLRMLTNANGRSVSITSPRRAA